MLSLFQESQQSSCVANKPDSYSSASSHPWFFQTRPKKEKQLKKKKWQWSQGGGGEDCVSSTDLPPEQVCVWEKKVSLPEAPAAGEVLSLLLRGEVVKGMGFRIWELEDIKGHWNTAYRQPILLFLGSIGAWPVSGTRADSIREKTLAYKKDGKKPPTSQIKHLVVWENEAF